MIHMNALQFPFPDLGSSFSSSSGALRNSDVLLGSELSLEHEGNFGMFVAKSVFLSSTDNVIVGNLLR